MLTCHVRHCDNEGFFKLACGYYICRECAPDFEESCCEHE